VLQNHRHLLGGLRAPLAVTGLGVVTAAGAGIEALERSLSSRASHLGPIDRFARLPVQTSAGGEVRDSWLASSAGSERALFMARRALEEAWPESQRDGNEPAPERIGIALGSSLGPAEEIELRARAHARPVPPEACREMSLDWLLAELAKAPAPGAPALRGPRSAFSVTCVSGLCALEQAAADIALDRADAMFVGALDTLTELMQCGFSSLRALSPSGELRPFDRAHDGIVLGEGAAFLRIEPLLNAYRRGARVSACILAQRLLSDTFHLTSPDPQGAAMARAIRRVLADAGLEARDIGCVTVTASGSPVYDRMLDTALVDALGESVVQELPVTTWEAAVGHVLAATGTVALAHAARLVETRSAHVVGRVEEVFPASRLRYVIDEPVPIENPIVLTLIVGFGGQNGVVLVSAPESAAAIAELRA
jgi:3-oxoacyl-[acyl-carrier-protein] synthase II